MGDKADFEVSGIAHGVGNAACGYIQIFRKHKFDTFYQNVPAARRSVGGDRDCLHSALIFVSIGVDFREDNPKSHSLSGTNIFDGYVQLDNASQLFQIGVTQIDLNGILTAFHL